MGSLDRRDARYRAIPRDVRRAVATECERFVLDHIERGQSFAVETTLRTTAAIDQALLARQRRFVADLHFIATDSIDENVARVIPIKSCPQLPSRGSSPPCL